MNNNKSLLLQKLAARKLRMLNDIEHLQMHKYDDDNHQIPNNNQIPNVNKLHKLLAARKLRMINDIEHLQMHKY